jgi:hypothetical protein
MELISGNDQVLDVFTNMVIDLNVRHLTCLRSFCVEHSGQLPDGERFLQVLDGRFRLFALILSVSPQNLCGFHPIYYSLNGLISRQQTP